MEEVRKEYRQKAERVDRLLGEEEEGRGRVRRRLDEFGQIVVIVAGMFNEHSSDTMMLLDVMATSRVDKLARATGLTSPQKAVEEGRVKGELRVQLSCPACGPGWPACWTGATRSVTLPACVLGGGRRWCRWRRR